MYFATLQIKQTKKYFQDNLINSIMTNELFPIHSSLAVTMATNVAPLRSKFKDALDLQNFVFSKFPLSDEEYTFLSPEPNKVWKLNVNLIQCVKVIISIKMCEIILGNSSKRSPWSFDKKNWPERY